MKFGHLEGVPQPQLGDLRTILANYLTTGMILQAWKNNTAGCLDVVGWYPLRLGFRSSLLHLMAEDLSVPGVTGLESEACSGELNHTFGGPKKPEKKWGETGPTISTNRYMRKSTLKIDCHCPLVMQGFQIFRVVSSDYGKPREVTPIPIGFFFLWQTHLFSAIYRGPITLFTTGSGDRL